MQAIEIKKDLMIRTKKGITFAVVVLASIIAFGFMEHVYTILPFGLSVIYLITSILLANENKKLTITITKTT
jgi:hypothetical protein